MTSDQLSLRSASHPDRIGNHSLRFGLAFRALRRLRTDKEDTAQVFEIIRALSGRTTDRGYRRMLKSAEGGWQAYMRKELSRQLQDADWLARFPTGTVGACYREFIGVRQLTPEGLANESRKIGDPDMDAAHPVAWYRRRLRDVHDIWHVLTGYGTERLGELCILAFTYGQIGEAGTLLIACLGGLDMIGSGQGQPYGMALLEAWRLGRKAAWLPSIDYERLFARPLEVARRDLGVARPAIYESIPLEARAAYWDIDERELRIARQ